MDLSPRPVGVGLTPIGPGTLAPPKYDYFFEKHVSSMFFEKAYLFFDPQAKHTDKNQPHVDSLGENLLRNKC